MESPRLLRFVPSAFGNLSPAEQDLLARVESGQNADFRVSPEDHEEREFFQQDTYCAGLSANDPHRFGLDTPPDPKRYLRASFLRWLILASAAKPYLRANGLCVFGAHVGGR